MKTKTRLNFFDRLMMAVTFAHVDEPEIALEMLSKPQNEKRKQKAAENRTGQRPAMRL